MQIIIPMTGYGSRFIAAGFQDLKPLIKVYNRPIIEWIVKGIFEGEGDYIFVCRRDHIDTIPELRKTLERIAPSGHIAVIDDWVKKGPVYDIMRIADLIDDNSPAIINYCDFYMLWDWDNIKYRIADYDGIIPCYTGFHPNLLPADNVYASCRKDNQDLLIEIKEKFSFEANKFNASHSAGTYCFKNGAILKKYCKTLIDSGMTLNGEYYASMVYNFMVKDNLKVWIPDNVHFFCQWGTPEDMQESLFWMNAVRSW